MSSRFAVCFAVFCRVICLSCASEFLAVPDNGSGCPAGMGHPPKSTSSCVKCGSGTWGDEGSTECTPCPPGTWSTVVAASSKSACQPCQQGTWSSQLGSPTPDSCQECPAGTWGSAEGLGSQRECTRCPVGFWSSTSGATTSDVCQPCPKATWGPQPGANNPDSCLKCAPGTWSNTVGASAQSSCQKCEPGTWSEVWGLTDGSSCNLCSVGTYQPAAGQASKSVCLECPPGRYNPMPGVAECAPCPAGCWSDTFAATSCTVCPIGQWTFSSGSMRHGDCVRCSGSPDCLPDASALVTINVRGIDSVILSAATKHNLLNAILRQLAQATGISRKSILDLQGNASSVSVGKGIISAWLVDLHGTSGNAIAASLYDAKFRQHLVDASRIALESSEFVHFWLGAISLSPKPFVKPTTTTTITTITTTTTLLTTSPSTSRVAGEGEHRDFKKEATQSSGANAWIDFRWALNILFVMAAARP